MKEVILTPEGHKKLQAEIEYLSNDKRREVAERIRIAREFGDITENAEYDDAKNEQAMLESRIAQLEDKLRSATVIDASDLGTDVVGITFHAGMLGPDGGVDPSLPLGRIVDHVDYVVDLIGVDHVGFGSDFDGAVVPEELGGAAGFPRLVSALRDAGYAHDDVDKITHGNWLRVLESTWR